MEVLRADLAHLPVAILRCFAAAVAELADALDSGSSGSKIPWRFDSSQPHFSIGQGMCFDAGLIHGHQTQS